MSLLTVVFTDSQPHCQLITDNCILTGRETHRLDICQIILLSDEIDVKLWGPSQRVVTLFKEVHCVLNLDQIRFQIPSPLPLYFCISQNNFFTFLFCFSKMNINIKIDFKLALSADPPPRHLLLRWVSWPHSSLSSKFSLFVFFLFFPSWAQYPTMSQSSQHQSEPLDPLIQLMSFTQLSRRFSFPNVFKARQQPSFHFLPSKL